MHEIEKKHIPMNVSIDAFGYINVSKVTYADGEDEIATSTDSFENVHIIWLFLLFSEHEFRPICSQTIRFNQRILAPYFYLAVKVWNHEFIIL